MQHAQHHRNRRAVACVVLAAALGLVSLTLTQCTSVSDRLTGLSLNKKEPISCIKQCNNAALLVKDECKKAFDTSAAECKDLAEPDRTACLNEASATREACIAASNAQKQQCQASCHTQGSGSGG